jgi:hypothetical protein
MFQKRVLFPSSSEKRETLALLGPLEKVQLFLRDSTEYVSLSPRLKRETEVSSF